MDSHGSQWFLDSGDGPMLSFDFAWEKVVVDSCLASCKMELALEILCEAG